MHTNVANTLPITIKGKINFFSSPFFFFLYEKAKSVHSYSIWLSNQRFLTNVCLPAVDFFSAKKEKNFKYQEPNKHTCKIVCHSNKRILICTTCNYIQKKVAQSFSKSGLIGKTKIKNNKVPKPSTIAQWVNIHTS